MPLHVPTFLTRTGSAIVFVAIMLTGLLWNDWSVFVLVSLIQALCLREYFLLMKKIQPNDHWAAWLPIVMQLFAFFMLCSLSPLINTLPLHSDFFIIFWALLFCFPVLIILINTLSKHASWNAAMQSFGGLLYITLPMMLLINLHNKSMLLPIALIAMIWINDTMAYIVGSFIGKTPFSEISPKKTWEGTIGGAVLAIATAIVWYMLSHNSAYYIKYGLGQYNMGYWIGLSICAGVAGTAGDLLESKLKRMAGVKDSGNIMPGHGGALDRFDSLLVAVPFAACLTFLLS